MPEVYLEDPADEFDPTVDLREVVGDQEPGGGISFTSEAQDSTRIWWIPASKIRSAARYFLGYSFADDASPYRLYRELPAVDPEVPTLRAYAVSFQKVAVESQSANPNGEPYKESPFLDPSGNSMWYTGYQQCIATVRYRSFGRMRFLTDEFVLDYTDEWKRFVTWNADPAVNALSVDGYQLIFRESGGGGDEPVANTTAFPSQIAELLAKTTVSMTWHNVPHNYLSADPDILQPTKITDRLGTVNDTAFLGYRIGTMLLLAVKAEPVLFPVVPADDYDIIGGWNLTLVWEYFEPTKGVSGSAYRGHRIFPWRKNGLFYYANREDNTKELLRLTDHNKVFQHHADTS